jgi:pyruvate kinase
MGPACWSEEGIAKLIDAGMNIARFNFSHGDHAAHQAVLDRVRKVAAAKGVHVATALDTKGPEIRTAMLRDGKDIQIQAGQMVKIVAVGDVYTSWEGHATPQETVIGCSYAKLCHDVGPGSKILVADGTLSLVVTEVRRLC